jgi:hypothetical protein
VSDSGQWFDHPIADLSPAQRAALDQSLRAEGIPATFGPTAVRTDIAYEARVGTLIAEARATVPAGPPPGQPPAYPGAPGYPVAASAPTNNNAVLALILGLVSLAVCQIIGPVAVIIGQRARREIARTGEQGDGMALAGVITGAISTVILALGVVALIAIIVIAAASSG